MRQNSIRLLRWVADDFRETPSPPQLSRKRRRRRGNSQAQSDYCNIARRRAPAVPERDAQCGLAKYRVHGLHDVIDGIDVLKKLQNGAVRGLSGIQLDPVGQDVKKEKNLASGVDTAIDSNQ